MFWAWAITFLAFLLMTKVANDYRNWFRAEWESAEKLLKVCNGWREIVADRDAKSIQLCEMLLANGHTECMDYYNELVDMKISREED